ncbi:MAG: pilus assembly protein PilM [Kiritimatiellia bacterium]
MAQKKSKSRSGKPFIVVELGSRWVKAALARPSRRGAALSGLYIAEVDGSAQSLQKALSAAMKTAGSSKAPVAACIPRQMVNVRMLEMPSTDQAELEDMLDLQVGRQTPYSKDEIVYDYRIGSSGREGYSRIMLAIAQRSILRQRFSVLEAAGVEEAVMSVSTEGLLNWYGHAFSEGKSGKTSVVLDIDSYYTDFCVIAGDQLLFTQSILTGAEELAGGDAAATQKYCREAKRLLEAYRGESDSPAPERIIITGAGPHVKDLHNALNTETDLPVETRDCTDALGGKVRPPAGMEKKISAVSLVSLAGMALAQDGLELNLVPESVLLRKKLTGKARNLTALAAMIMAVMVSGSLYATTKFSTMESRLDAVRAESERIAPEVKKIEMWTRIANTGAKRADLKRSMVNLLNEIHHSVPEKSGVMFQNMGIAREGGRARFEGSSDSRGEISGFVQNLENSPLFENVKADRINRDSRTRKYKFTVVCELEKEE